MDHPVHDKARDSRTQERDIADTTSIQDSDVRVNRTQQNSKDTVTTWDQTVDNSTENIWQEKTAEYNSKHHTRTYEHSEQNIIRAEPKKQH